MATHRIAVLSGDGIGPEVTAEAVKVLRTVGRHAGASLEFIRQLVRGRGNNPDEAIRDLLLGRVAPVTFEINGVPQRLRST